MKCPAMQISLKKCYMEESFKQNRDYKIYNF